MLQDKVFLFQILVQRSNQGKVYSDDFKPAVTVNRATVAMKFSGKCIITRETVRRELKRTRQISEVGEWLPPDLSPNNRQHCVDSCKSVFTRQLQCPFWTGLLLLMRNVAFVIILSAVLTRDLSRKQTEMRIPSKYHYEL